MRGLSFECSRLLANCFPDTGQREHEVGLTGYVNPGRTGTAFLPRAGKRRWRWVAAHCCGTGNDRGLGHIDFLAASRDRRGGSQCVLPIPAGTDHSDALYSTTIAPVEDRCNPSCVALLQPRDGGGPWAGSGADGGPAPRRIERMFDRVPQVRYSCGEHAGNRLRNRLRVLLPHQIGNAPSAQDRLRE